MRRAIEAIRALASRLGNDSLLQNAGWYGLGEVAARVSRLLATVILARMLSAADLGVAAIAITCFELVRVLTNNGIGNWIVRTGDDRLAAACNTAYRAAIAACLAAVAVQIAIGVGLYTTTGRLELLWMMASLAGVYIVMIPGLVPVYLLQREQRFRSLAGIAVAQVVADNALTAALALAGFGAWSIVLPKLLTAPIWLIGVLRLKRWRADGSAGAIPMADLLRFCAPVLGSECLTAVRLNLDKLLVGAMLGVEMLGIYYFAFNAGIGLSLVLTTALSNALYPHLAVLSAQPQAMLDRFRSALRRLVAPVAALLALQAAAALIYVPLIFGRHWSDAAPLVAALCAGAISKPFYDATCQLVRAAGLPRIELLSSALLTLATLSALALGMTQGLAAGIAFSAAAAFLLQATLAAVAVRTLRATMTDQSRRQTIDGSTFQIAGAQG